MQSTRRILKRNAASSKKVYRRLCVEQLLLQPEVSDRKAFLCEIERKKQKICQLDKEILSLSSWRKVPSEHFGNSTRKEFPCRPEVDKERISLSSWQHFAIFTKGLDFPNPWWQAKFSLKLREWHFHSWMRFLHPWMTFVADTFSSMDGVFICHIFLKKYSMHIIFSNPHLKIWCIEILDRKISSMDESAINASQLWMKKMDDRHGQS